jgi:hypothetical protein
MVGRHRLYAQINGIWVKVQKYKKHFEGDAAVTTSEIYFRLAFVPTSKSQNQENHGRKSAVLPRAKHWRARGS